MPGTQHRSAASPLVGPVLFLRQCLSAHPLSGSCSLYRVPPMPASPRAPATNVDQSNMPAIVPLLRVTCQLPAATITRARGPYRHLRAARRASTVGWDFLIFAMFAFTRAEPMNHEVRRAAEERPLRADAGRHVRAMAMTCMFMSSFGAFARRLIIRIIWGLVVRLVKILLGLCSGGVSCK